ncbi:TM1802 family CRISPR-associated protein [Sulfobacillus thermosulfidooxidans]|uniref:TM1802 family CRISPR-associated protein n=1 Tax=Sulfobacillus thermosulfidooxidans TaxID=28034 RepID=UPI0006B68698|nr:TM1802 family CRISPR-associated protein [Sulfobacillus thermosulfidooxidans]
MIDQFIQLGQVLAASLPPDQLTNYITQPLTLKEPQTVGILHIQANGTITLEISEWHNHPHAERDWFWMDFENHENQQINAIVKPQNLYGLLISLPKIFNAHRAHQPDDPQWHAWRTTLNRHSIVLKDFLSQWEKPLPLTSSKKSVNLLNIFPLVAQSSLSCDAIQTLIPKDRNVNTFLTSLMDEIFKQQFNNQKPDYWALKIDGTLLAQSPLYRQYAFDFMTHPSHDTTYFQTTCWNCHQNKLCSISNIRFRLKFFSTSDPRSHLAYNGYLDNLNKTRPLCDDCYAYAKLGEQYLLHDWTIALYYNKSNKTRYDLVMVPRLLPSVLSSQASPLPRSIVTFTPRDATPSQLTQKLMQWSDQVPLLALDGMILETPMRNSTDLKFFHAISPIDPARPEHLDTIFYHVTQLWTRTHQIPIHQITWESLPVICLGSHHPDLMFTTWSRYLLPDISLQAHSPQSFFQHFTEATVHHIAKLWLDNTVSDPYRILRLLSLVTLTYLFHYALEVFSPMPSPIDIPQILQQTYAPLPPDQLPESVKYFIELMQQSHFTPTQIGLFALGEIMGIISAQQYRELKSTPILRAINVQGMKNTQITQLATLLIGKCRDYDCFHTTAQYFWSIFQQLWLDQPPNPRQQTNPWENVLFPLLGYAHYRLHKQPAQSAQTEHEEDTPND